MSFSFLEKNQLYRSETPAIDFNAVCHMAKGIHLLFCQLHSLTLKAVVRFCYDPTDVQDNYFLLSKMWYRYYNLTITNEEDTRTKVLNT